MLIGAHDIIMLIAIWGLITLSCMGAGYLVMLFFTCSPRLISRNLPALPWLGMGIWIGVLQIWHLFLPVNQAIFFVLFVAGFLPLPHLLSAIRKEVSLNVSWGLCVLAWLIASYFFAHEMADNSFLPIKDYDAALYHISATRLNQASSIVPGVANLHGRYGFNNSIFLVMAALESLECYCFSPIILSGMLVLWFGLTVVWTFFSACFRRRLGVRDIYRILLFTPVLFDFWESGNSSKTDMHVAYFQMAMGDLALALFEDTVWRKKDHTGLANGLGLWPAIFFLSCVTVTLKLSALIESAGIMVFCFGCAAGNVLGERKSLLQALTQSPWFNRKIYIRCASVAVLLCGIWMVRGVILSGYPLYPSGALAVSVEWKTPNQFRQSEFDMVRTWARAATLDKAVLTDTSLWLPRWWETRFYKQYNLHHFILKPVLLVGLTLLGIGVCFRKKSRGVAFAAFAWFCLHLVAIIYWFKMAPDIRFAGCIVWILAAGFASLVFAAGTRRVTAPLIILLGAASFACSWDVMLPYLNFDRMSTMQKFSLGGNDGVYIRNKARRGYYFWARNASKPLVLKSGETINYRLPQSDQIWDAPLPCTARMWSQDLTFRTPGQWKDGFIIREQP